MLEKNSVVSVLLTYNTQKKKKKRFYAVQTQISHDTFR